MSRIFRLAIIVISLSIGLTTIQAQNTIVTINDRIQYAIENNAHELDLSNLDLTELPARIARVETLTRLDLSGNQLKTLPPEIGELAHLQELWLNDNPLETLPDEIGWLQNLRFINLSNTKLTELPDSFWTLSNLRGLSLRRTSLDGVPVQIGRLSKLGYLDLRDMQLSSLPDELNQLRQLRVLDLGGNNFSTLPEVVLQLTKLEELHIHYTPLNELTPEIDQLANLKLLDLRNTQLTTLPPEVGNLYYLHSLLLENTQISELPVEIGFLDNLLYLWTYNTPLPYDVTPQQSPPNLDEILSGMRSEAIALNRVPPARLMYVNTYPEAPVTQYGAPLPPQPQPPADMYFEDYGINPIVYTIDDSLSTFAMDVDTASYTLTRSYLMDFNQLPPPEAVRAEEFINFFPVSYDPPTEGAFSINMDAAESPFRVENRLLLRVGIQGRVIPPEDRDPALLIFVIDISGSMSGEERLGRVKDSLEILVKSLRQDDRVGIVVYANNTRVLLEPTSAAEQDVILSAISNLQTEGSTYAEAGLRLGYDLAARFQQEGETTRLILCSDGVANVGETGPDAILETVSDAVDGGITLTTVGFGMGNFNDILMEQLANRGNGNYFYVDDLREARRIFGSGLTSTLQSIATDAQIQVAFNPNVVNSYRLVGYENRAIDDDDFRDDLEEPEPDDVQAGQIGAGHTITALYELELLDGSRSFFSNPSRMQIYIIQATIVAIGAAILISTYQIMRRGRPKKKKHVRIGLLLLFASMGFFSITPQPKLIAQGNELVATTFIRYQDAESGIYEEINTEYYLTDVYPTIDDAPADFRLVVGVAEFADLLRESPLVADGSYGKVLDLLHPLRGASEATSEVIILVEKAQSLSAR